jgi:phosphomannomutase
MGVTKIQFGTDGWRAIIGEDYTTDNVARVSHAVAIWLKKNAKAPKNLNWSRLSF